MLNLKKRIIVRILKNYKDFKLYKKQNLFLEILNDFDKINHVNKNSRIDQFFFYHDIKIANLIIKQFFSHSFVYENKFFSRLFLLYNNMFSAIFPLPLFALKSLKRNKIKINYLLSLTLFKFYQIYKITIGIKFAIQVILKSLLLLRSSKRENLSNSVYFINIIEKFLPSKKNGSDLVSSILNNDTYKFSNSKIFCDCKKKTKANKIEFLDLFVLNSFVLILIYFYKFIGLFIFSLLSLITNKWYISILFEEKLKQSLIKLKNNNDLPKKIYFNQTSFIYRPLWTYLDKKKKFNVSMILFGANIYEESSAEVFFSTMTWPHYFVWSKNWEEKLKKILYFNFNVTVCDYIGFNDTKKKITEKFDVMIFDDEPFRDWYQSYLLRNNDHWNTPSCIKYINDLKKIFEEKNLVVAFKSKKFNKVKTPKKYFKLFDNKQNFRILSPEYSAHDLINSSKLIISFPFSSTAILAKKLNKESVYYFPDKINNKPWINENIKIVEGYQQLKKYIDEMVF
jgi:polysaccharide biosynthesis PFTS motif protein